jgi:hypothetical protein
MKSEWEIFFCFQTVFGEEGNNQYPMFIAQFSGEGKKKKKKVCLPAGIRKFKWKIFFCFHTVFGKEGNIQYPMFNGQFSGEGIKKKKKSLSCGGLHCERTEAIL